MAYGNRAPAEFVDLRAHLDELLADAPDDPAIVARLYVGRGGCHARLHEPGWGRAATNDYLAAARTFLAAGEPDAAATTIVNQAWSVDMVLHGMHQTALRLGEAIEMAVSPGHAIRFLSQRARLQLWRGKVDLALADLARASSLAAEQVIDVTAAAYLCWAEIEVHASLDDQDRVLSALQRADGLRGPWYDTITGLLFESQAVDALSHLGLVGQARKRHALVDDRRSENPGEAAIADICFHALLGDPHLVEPAWNVLRASSGMEPWQVARMGLLTAYARTRIDEDPGELAATALDDAERLGVMDSLTTLEPLAIDAVLDAACDHGSPAALRLRRARRGHHVQLLGPPAIRTPDGHDLPIPAQAVTLLAALAGQDQGLTPERLGSILWEDAPAGDDLHRRIRRLLHRVRAIAPVVARTTTGRLLIDPDAVIDLVQLDHVVERCRAAGDGPLLASALTRARALADVTTGSSLRAREEFPDDVRARLLRQLHWIHTRAATYERDRGRDDLARGELRLALDHVPDDDRSAAELARLLLAEGRRFDAAEVLRTTADVLAEARVAPSSGFADLASRLLPG